MPAIAVGFRRAAAIAAAVAAIAVLAAYGTGAMPAPPTVTAIVGATVFDATGAPPHPATVLISAGRILAVGPALVVPPGAQVVHAEGEALLPGFFDLHTHWTPAGEPRTTPQIASADVAAGVTTVDDFNAAPESFAPRRRWLAGLVAPHVNFCARLSTPGGHGADWADTATTKWVNTPEAARAAVRSLLPYHPDCLGEVFTDGWRYGEGPDFTSMGETTLAALVDEAHKNHLKVLTHTVTVARGFDAAQAHVDVIDHSLQDRELDAQTIAEIKRSGSALAPTLAVYEPVKPGHAPPKDPNTPRFQQTLRKFGYALHNVKALYDAGVPIVLGTDSGMPSTPHGVSTLHEMELLVQAGLPPAAALMAGTANSARAMDELADRGTIEPGKRADLVLIHGAPWAHIADLHKTDRVFIDGRLVHGANAATAMPALLARAEIDDFERPDGRSNLDTLPTDDFDGGLDRSVEISQIVARAPTGHALRVAARMSVKAEPYAGVILPLTRGSIQPVDASAFRGVRFDIRGNATDRLVVNTLTGRWSAPVSAGEQWQTIEVPFTALQHDKAPGGGASPLWTGNDLTEVELSATRPAGEKLWMEIDNVIFYR